MYKRRGDLGGGWRCCRPRAPTGLSKLEFDNFEHGFPEGFGPARLGLSGLCRRRRVRGLSALCRGVELSAEPGGARRPCRLPDPADVWPDRQLHRQEQCRPRRRLAAWQRRIPVRAVSVDFLCRSDRARRRSDAARSRGRNLARGADLRGHAAADGARAAADVRRLHSLLVLRQISAGAAQPSRL